MRRLIQFIAACAVIGAGTAWALTRPPAVPDEVAADHTADAAKGALVFAAAGCASCHAAEGAQDKTLLGGGHALASDFGTFYAPNISPGPQGMGDFSLPEFARAMRDGVSPEGRFYYPAFPYTSYSRMTDEDIADLYAYLMSLPAVDTPSKPHDVSFPFTLRRGLGLWNMLYLRDDFIVTQDLNEEELRGRYLVEGPGHCAECHTARTALGGLDRTVWMKGAPNPSGKGRIPDITPAALDWSQSDLVAYFTTGFTPDYDSVGGSMAAVVANLALLPESDRKAIAAYLKALPAN